MDDSDDPMNEPGGSARVQPLAAQASGRLSDRVARQLTDLIEASRLQPGDRLPAERVLSAQLGVSRTAVREAIQKLASRGLLEGRVGAGTFVRAQMPPWHEQAISPLVPLIHDDPQYRYDVLEARTALERTAAWHAAMRARPEDKDRIRRCFDVMVEHQQRGDTELSARADAQFHLAIAEASHNVVVVQVMRGLFKLVLSTVAQSRRMMFVHDDPKVLERLTRQHHDLMQAILAGEPEQAQGVIGEHLGYVHQKLVLADADAARLKRLDRFSSSAGPLA
jgi:GntR family L-lactate dehydrogenase operon transcriptional regulator